MAETLIAIGSRALRRGGSRGRRRVAGRAGPRARHESADTVSFMLRSLDGSPLPRSAPGQYLSVACTCPTARARSVSTACPRRRAQWRITRQGDPRASSVDGRAPAGEVSNFLYQNVFEGDDRDGVDAVRRSRAAGRRRAAAARVRGHRVHADDRDAQPPRRHRGQPADLGAPRRPVRRQSRAPRGTDRTGGAAAVRGRCTAGTRTSGARRPEGSLRDGRADLGEVAIAPGTRGLPVRSVAVHARTCARRSSRRTCPPRTSTTRCSARTAGRPPCESHGGFVHTGQVWTGLPSRMFSTY